MRHFLCNFNSMCEPTMEKKQRGGAAAQPPSRFYEGDSCPSSKGTPHGAHASVHASLHARKTRADRHSPDPALPFLLDEDLDPWRCHSEVFNPSVGGLIQRWDNRP